MSKNNVNTRVLSGFIELLPEQQIIFDEIKRIVEDGYESAGFLPIETPIIERTEVLLAKAGGETEKQIYRFEKGDNDLSLRFDLTIPFARYVVEHYNDLTFPFASYKIGKVYRGERAQKGRYREFYQADIDIVGENSLHWLNELRVIGSICNTLEFILKHPKINYGEVEVKLSNRKIWDGFFYEFTIEGDKKIAVMTILDKKHKIPEADFILNLKELVGEKITKLIMAILKITYIPNVGISIPQENHPDLTFINNNELMKQGIKDLENLMEHFDDKPVQIDLSIIRGLDYYTGTVFETFVKDHPELGSVASGGRYDNLCSNFTDRNIVGFGGSIGLSRLLIPIIEGLKPERSCDVLILPQEEKFIKKSKKLEDDLKGQGFSLDFFYEDWKFKKKMEYANKIGAKFVIIIGEDEFETDTLTIKNMSTGEQQKINTTEAILYLTKALNKQG